MVCWCSCYYTFHLFPWSSLHSFYFCCHFLSSLSSYYFVPFAVLFTKSNKIICAIFYAWSVTWLRYVQFCFFLNHWFFLYRPSFQSPRFMKSLYDQQKIAIYFNSFSFQNRNATMTKKIQNIRFHSMISFHHHQCHVIPLVNLFDDNFLCVRN